MRRIVFVLIILAIPFIINLYVVKDQEEVSKEIIEINVLSNGTVKRMDLEEYLIGVLAGEMPISFEEEALKAQAVVSRTYALKRIKDENTYDVVDNTNNQVYLSNSELKKSWGNNYSKNLAKLKRILGETKNECIFYGNNLIDALFFSTSPGMTENSEDIFPNKIPYLRSVPSKWDKESPYFSSTYEFSLEEFYSKLNLEYNDFLTIEKTKVTSTGRIKALKINNVNFTSNDLLKKLGLKSSYFTVEKVGNLVKIESFGYGHSVGLSQYGANGMAKEGYTYKEIIEHYYTNINIKEI